MCVQIKVSLRAFVQFFSFFPTLCRFSKAPLSCRHIQARCLSKTVQMVHRASKWHTSTMQKQISDGRMSENQASAAVGGICGAPVQRRPCGKPARSCSLCSNALNDSRRGLCEFKLRCNKSPQLGHLQRVGRGGLWRHCSAGFTLDDMKADTEPDVLHLH